MKIIEFGEEGVATMPQYHNQPEETDIAVWGPTQSGKDWLLRGFAKELDFYNNNERYSNGFLFELLEITDDGSRQVIAAPPHDIAPTAKEKDYVYNFRRRAIRQDEAHQISSHMHKINFHNNAGANLLGAAANQSKYESAFIPILRSKYLLIILDSTINQSANDMGIRTENDNDLETNIRQRPDINKEEYLRILAMLLQLLADSSIRDRQLAICMTKMDMTGSAGSNPWRQLETIFGQKIYNLINRYRGTFNIEAFATSAAGYYYNDNNQHSANFIGGQLIDAERWNPVNCAAPFFWIFQGIEIEKIRSTSNFFNREYNLNRYIKYPGHRNL
jgi:hypothetical protein